MANKLALEALDRSLKDVRQCSRQFGGILVILSGDFVRHYQSLEEVQAPMKLMLASNHYITVELEETSPERLYPLPPA